MLYMGIWRVYPKERLCSHISSIGRITGRAKFHTSNIVKSEEIGNSEDPNGVSKQLKNNVNVHKAEISKFGKRNRKRLDESSISHEHVHLHNNENSSVDSSYLGSLVQGLYSHTHSHSQVHTHSHSHSHSHGGINPLLIMDAQEIRKNAGVRVTWIGLGINVGIAIGKFVGGIVFHSQALFADSIHALSDMISDFLTLFSVRLASNKPTEDYPYGYGKMETIGSLAVSTILMTAGVSIGWSSLCAMLGPMLPHTIMETMASFSGHSHAVESVPENVTDVNAAWIAAASIAAKEWIFRATKKVAVETNSNVLLANAWHHRVDSLTSLVALVTITSSHLLGIQSLDTLGGLLVSVLIIKAGAEGMAISIKELIDSSLPHDDARHLEIEDVIKDALLAVNKSSSTGYKLKDLMILSSGPNLHAHAKIEVPYHNVADQSYTLRELSALRQELRSTVMDTVVNVKKLQVEYLEEKIGQTYDLDQDTIIQTNSHSSTHKDVHSHTHTH